MFLTSRRDRHKAARKMHTTYTSRLVRCRVALPKMAGATLTECFLVTDKFAVSATELLLGIFITGCYCTALYMLL